MNYITKALDMCLEMEKELGCQIFFSYSPHVNGVDIRVYANGWSQYADQALNETWYEYYGEDSLFSIINAIPHAVKVSREGTEERRLLRIKQLEEELGALKG